MFFGCQKITFKHCKWKSHHKRKSFNTCFQNIYQKRKETLSSVRTGFDTLPPDSEGSGRRRTSFFASLKAGLTVEAAVVLPVFFLCMITVLQFGMVMETAARFGSALCETGERMAINAYAIENGSANPVIMGSMSALYARGKVMGKAGNTKAVRNVNFLLSSFQKEDELIDLFMTYQVKSLVGGINIPYFFFAQRGCVRAWTGRSGSEGSGNMEDSQSSGATVYVTEHGSVYHTDENCTHIRLSIRSVDRSALGTLRNVYGGRYHACENCGANAGGQVYITSDGTRYHSTLHCSGLRRTVREVSMEEAAENLRPCTRCAGQSGT